MSNEATYKESEIVDLFPYQIKNLDNFYHRNHPKQIHPNSNRYVTYWSDFLKKCLEGNWIYDDGTWVFMPPKLFFYVNYPVIANKDRDNVFPDLRDNEWIIFSYLLGVDGFSGFEDDHEYTCHRLVKKYELSMDPSLSEDVRKGYALSIVEEEELTDNVRRSDGSFKKYVDPWIYLTRHYLIDHPAEGPLGQALYENPMQNGCILSARSTGKSFTMFVGDFYHEFLTSGIKRYKDRDKINKRLLFGMGSAMAPQLQRSINNVKYAYYNMPGSYKFKKTGRSSDLKPIEGALFKKIQGSWEVGSEFNHIVKAPGARSIDLQGSSVQMVALTKDRTAIGAGDRFRRIYVEEFGFLENALDVHAANADSLKSTGERVGSAIYLGTGGNMQTIRQPKEIFERAEAYEVFGIPNYWSKANRKCGLFIPKYYAMLKFKDKNGNTRLKEAYKAVIEQRKIDKEEKDSVSYEVDIMFNPLTPQEMLRPGSSTILPKQEAQNQLNKLDTYDIFRKRAQIGSLIWNPLEPRGVEWKKDLVGSLKPITDMRIDDNITFTNKEGAVIIYEQPPEYIPSELYWILYDPAANSGDGESFHSILVYKHFYVGNEKTLYDTIVAEWIGRKETLDDNYELVVKLAKYFNARIFPEVNIAGFVDWCIKNRYGSYLEGDAYHLEHEIHGHRAIKRSYNQVGFQLNTRKKIWCLRRLRDWLMETKEVDAISGAPLVKTMDWIFSPRILNEIVNFVDDPKENFDHISSLLGLMLLIGKLGDKDPVNLDDVEIDDRKSTLIPTIITEKPREVRRGKFLSY